MLSKRGSRQTSGGSCSVAWVRNDGGLHPRGVGEAGSYEGTSEVDLRNEKFQSNVKTLPFTGTALFSPLGRLIQVHQEFDRCQ